MRSKGVSKAIPKRPLWKPRQGGGGPRCGFSQARTLALASLSSSSFLVLPSPPGDFRRFVWFALIFVDFVDFPWFVWFLVIFNNFVWFLLFSLLSLIFNIFRWFSLVSVIFCDFYDFHWFLLIYMHSLIFCSMSFDDVLWLQLFSLIFVDFRWYLWLSLICLIFGDLFYFTLFYLCSMFLDDFHFLYEFVDFRWNSPRTAP